MRGIKEIQAERIAHTLNVWIDKQIETIGKRYEEGAKGCIQIAKAKREARAAYKRADILISRIAAIYSAYPVTSDDRNELYRLPGIVERVETVYSRFK